MGRLSLRVFSGLVFAFLWIPVLVLVVYSFNDSKLNIRWHGFTLKWYAELLSDHRTLEATYNTLLVACASTAGATVLGTLTALALHRYRWRWQGALESLLYIPVIIPETVMGISLLALFSAAGVRLNLLTVTLAHITFSASFVTITVLARLHGMDNRLEEAAMDLGCNRWQTFWRVTVWQIAPGVLAGALLAFTLSIDDFVVTFFTTGPGATTLPVRIYSMVKFGVSPVINALSTVMLLVTAVTLLAFHRFTRAQGGPQS